MDAVTYDAGGGVFARRSIAITCRLGEAVSLPVASSSSKEVAEAGRRIAEGIQAASEAPAPLLAPRAGQSVKKWRRQLSGHVETSAHYRRAPTSIDELQDLLANPAASVEQRIGAALAMRATKRSDSAERIRIVADVTASPRLRVALDQIARNRLCEHELEEALGDDVTVERVATERVR
jgi:hypothetical protein